jgi:c-di-GMP-binding flagellar brake protein YcgR
MADRIYPRYRVRVPVYISLDDGVYRKELRLLSHDVSAGGLCFFETGRSVPLDAETRIFVARLGNLDPNAHLRGRVVHRFLDPATSRFRVGIEFTDFLGITRDELVARILEWESEDLTAGHA